MKPARLDVLTHYRGGNRRTGYLWAAGVGMIVAVIGFVAVDEPFVDHLGDLIFDGYQRALPRTSANAPVAVVDIDEASIREVGQWPWPRTTIAKIVDRLGDLGAVAIAFDMVFPEADRTSPLNAITALKKAGVEVTVPPDTALDNDAMLGEAFSKNPVIAGIALSNETQTRLPSPKAGFAFAGADPKKYLASFRGGVANLPVLNGNAQGLGFFSFPLSGDGVVRSLPLLANAGGQLYPALSIEALRVAQGAASFVVRSTGASGESDSGRSAMTAVKVGALAMPTGQDGQFRIYYSGLPDLKTMPAARLIDPGAAAKLEPLVAGHIVLVGTSAVGLRDLVATPFQQALPGVRVHAEIIDQIIGQAFLVRPDWASGAETVLALILGLGILVAEWRTGAWASGLTALGLIGLALATSWAAFVYSHLLINPIAPAGAVLAVFTVTMPILLLMADREKRFIRGAFAHYLSPTLVGRLAENPEALRLGGETRELTILFSDIRGFTALSENLDPDALTRLLNGFLTPATDILLESEATIDKYIGDAIMAFWNAPLDIADHPRKACLAALGILKAVDALNCSVGAPALKVGLGLHTGPCCVGNLGSTQRFSYSAIGDSVNVASRVESLTKQYGISILVTQETRSAAPDLAFIEVDLVRVAGRAEPVSIHALVGDSAYAKSPQLADHLAAHHRLLAHYRHAEIDEAEAALAEARSSGFSGLEGLYDVYSRRLAVMRTEPPGSRWDGVFAAENK